MDRLSVDVLQILHSWWLRVLSAYLHHFYLEMTLEARIPKWLLSENSCHLSLGVRSSTGLAATLWSLKQESIPLRPILHLTLCLLSKYCSIKSLQLLSF